MGKKQLEKQTDMFAGNPADMPLFSGVAMTATIPTFKPKPNLQDSLFGTVLGCRLCMDTGQVVVKRGQEPRYCTCEAGINLRRGGQEESNDN